MENQPLIALIIYLTLSLNSVYAFDNNTIAHVSGEIITTEDIEPHPAFLKYRKRDFPELSHSEIVNQMRKEKLHSLIWQKLNQSLVQQYNLTPTTEEVERYLKVIKMPIPSDVSEDVKIELKEVSITFAKDAIKQFKINKHLYQTYGGTIIFQQANPIEPIGAYRQFLEEQENQNQLEIYNDDYRTGFWQYYLAEHPSNVSKNQVDFSIPWWEKRLNKKQLNKEQ